METNQPTRSKRNRFATTAIAVAGLAVGGLSLTQVASAQGYGDDTSTPTVEVQTLDADGANIVPIQDDLAPADDAEGDEDGERRGHRRGCNVEVAAETIGVTVEDLRASLDAGESIADVASANDVDPDAVVAAMVTDAEAKIAEKVESGRLTQEEADVRLAERTERINDRVFGVDDDGDVEGDQDA